MVDVALGVWTFGLSRVCVQLRKQSREEKRKRGIFGSDLEKEPISKVYAVPSSTQSLTKWYFECWLVTD